MRCSLILVLLVSTLLALPDTASADKPVDEQGVPFGNGFPSGEHYNLNIIAKWEHFTCPAPEYDPETGEQVYGNVIFIPRVQGNDPITILMESGKKGPKDARNTLELEVTDWCTESFPDEGQGKGDSAVLRLPANDKGYAVYARITGKPNKDDDGGPEISISPRLFYVEDEQGHDLILLGLVDRQGVATFSSDGETITRYDSNTKGKGALKAINATALFEWTGEVCYIQDDTTAYCHDEVGNYICADLDLCCVDMDGDLIYDACDLLSDVGVVGDDGTTLECPLSDPGGYPYDPLLAQCRSYENEWIFNIADFVGYLWDIDTTGAYVIQVRFYPIR